MNASSLRRIGSQQDPLICFVHFKYLLVPVNYLTKSNHTCEEESLRTKEFDGKARTP